MAMIEFGDYYINPRYVSCVGITEEFPRGSISGAKCVYEVFVICQGQKMVTPFKTRSDAKKLVQHIKIYAG